MSGSPPIKTRITGDEDDCFFQEVDDGLDWSKAEHTYNADGSLTTRVPFKQPPVVLTMPYYTARITGVKTSQHTRR